MPELPDVEMFKGYLDSTALHKKIRKTEVSEERILSGVSQQMLARRLKGSELEETKRHGKYLFARIRGDGWLVLHFGMTGELAYYKDPHDRPEHARMVLRFENGYELAYVSQRMLGQVSITGDIESFAAERGLGPDALSGEVDRERFLEMLEGRKGMIKPALMNQSMIAGIGNVYSDEILFQAKVNPKTPANKLSVDEKKRLYRVVRRVLRTAARNGADPEKMPRGYILPHREEGSKCPVCGGKVKKMTVSGRTSYYCPRCQRRP
ncbi:MAG: Fpg/Nei family DNA glycosylase [Actinobacteria bacterium]|nr:Fpg/Nei family DNA glycosylase [Actinomycetota bacterium]